MTYRVEKSSRFAKAYKALAQQTQKRISKALEQFLKNPKHPRHPSLCYEKVIITKDSAYRSIRYSHAGRIIFKEYEEDDTTIIELIDVGGHETYDRLRRKHKS